MWALTPGEFLPLHLLVTLGLASLCGGVWWLGRNHSAKHRIRSAIIAPLQLGGFFAGGFLGWALNPAASYWTVLVYSNHGMLGGMISGFLISWWVWKYYRREVERNEDT